MGIFGNSSPFDEDVEKATSENNTSEQWGLIMEICDRAAASPAAARECLRAASRRLAHADPHVALQAATLLDACVANCGRAFLLEVASRDFEAELRRVHSRAVPAVAAKIRALLRKWAEGEFRDDPQLDLIPALYNSLRRSQREPSPGGPAPPSGASSTAAAAAAAERREQEELARAIALSLKESSAAPAPSLYPAVDPVPAPAPPPPRQVRALYDFEAAEDNELTFLAGEIVHVTDSSDPNWWKGQNARGEGLFPANFVTSDLSQTEPPASEPRRSVQFAETAPVEPAEEVARIDEAAMDAALAALLDADPEGPAQDERDLVRLERTALAAGPLIDAALERADRRHARLTQLSAELVDALNLYHELMREPLAKQPAYGPLPGNAPLPR